MDKNFIPPVPYIGCKILSNAGYYYNAKILFLDDENIEIRIVEDLKDINTYSNDVYIKTLMIPTIIQQQINIKNFIILLIDETLNEMIDYIENKEDNK